jgi:hypothetical protein
MKTELENVKISDARSIAVDQNYYWRRMDDCPIGVKVQLLTDGGIAVHGAISNQSRYVFIGWTPLPNKPEWMRVTKDVEQIDKRTDWSAA